MIEKEQKAVKFINNTLTDPPQFREETLRQLSKIYGYERCSFWLADSKGFLCSPLILKDYGKRLVRDYQKKYFTYDYLSPSNLTKTCFSNDILLLSQVVRKEELEKSKFYDLMKNNEYEHEITVLLKSSNKVIGALSIIRSEEENNFNNQDIANFQLIHKYLSYRLKEYIIYEYNNEIQNLLCDHSSIGLIIFGSSYTIYHQNDLAKEICELFSENNATYNPVSFFINKFLSNKPPTWFSGQEKSFLLPSFEEISMKIFPINIPISIPVNKSALNEEKLFMIMLERNKYTEPNHEVNRNYNFSPRELDIIQLIMNGFTNQEIANELILSVNTVKTHIRRIFEKSEATNRVNLINKIGASGNKLF